MWSVSSITPSRSTAERFEVRACLRRDADPLIDGEAVVVCQRPQQGRTSAGLAESGDRLGEAFDRVAEGADVLLADRVCDHRDVNCLHPPRERGGLEVGPLRLVCGFALKTAADDRLEALPGKLGDIGLADLRHDRQVGG